MGRWKVNSTPYECQMKCELGVITGHNNEDNADCDAYEARIAELERLLQASGEETQRAFNGFLELGFELNAANATLGALREVVPECIGKMMIGDGPVEWAAINASRILYPKEAEE